MSKVKKRINIVDLFLWWKQNVYKPRLEPELVGDKWKFEMVKSENNKIIDTYKELKKQGQIDYDKRLIEMYGRWKYGKSN